MPALRCSICSVNWPISEDFRDCPQCYEPTDRMTNATAIDEDEAQRLKAHADFERYYVETRGAAAASD